MGEEEQRECGTKHRSLSPKHQDQLQPRAKFSPPRLTLPLWMINERSFDTAQCLCTSSRPQFLFC